MNCRPGDLAVIKPPYYEPDVGRFVNVMHAAQWYTEVRARDGQLCRCAPGEEHIPAWVCEGPDNTFPRIIADDALRPIRNPGDEVTDEMVDLVGAAPNNEPCPFV